jgi:hypothetical protein
LTLTRQFVRAPVRPTSAPPKYLCVEAFEAEVTSTASSNPPATSWTSGAIADGRLLVCWYPERVTDGERSKAVAEVIVVEGRVVRP